MVSHLILDLLSNVACVQNFILILFVTLSSCITPFCYQSGLLHIDVSLTPLHLLTCHLHQQRSAREMTLGCIQQEVLELRDSTRLM